MSDEINKGIYGRFITLFPGLFIFLIVLIFFQTAANLASVVSIAPIMDVLLEKKVSDFSEISIWIINFFELKELSLLLVFSLFILFLFLANIIAILVQYWILQIKYKVIKHFMTDLHVKFFNANYSFFISSDSGEILNTFQKESEKLGDIFGAIGRMTSNLIQFSFYMLVPFYISFNLSIIFIISLIFLAGPVLYLNKRIYPFGEKNTQTANEYLSFLKQNFDASKLILSNARQKLSLSKFSDKFDNHANVTIPFQTFLYSVNLLFLPLGITAALFAVYWGYLSGISLSLISIIMFSFFRMMPLLGAIFTARSEITGFTPAYEQILKLARFADLQKNKFGSKKFLNLSSIELKNISFSFNGQNSLRNVNFTVNAGSSVAIIGKSGSGKTTLVDIILGLYQPSKGEVLINDTNSLKYDLNTFREKVSLVPQDPFLFDESIKDNLLWANPEATDEEIDFSLKLANIKGYIESLPNGLNTLVGDRGTSMSGGQRQRISLARALLKKPELIILDEATSSLDYESETLIQESIKGLSSDNTFIIIAHRFSTIENVDYVYVLEGGEILEEGTVKKLLETEGSYLSKMKNNQHI